MIALILIGWGGGMVPAVAQETGSSRNDPLAIGETGQVLSFEITVVDVVPDAMDLLTETSLTYPPPAAGNQYFLARIGVTYVGEASNNPNWQLDFKAVGASNLGYTISNQSCGSFPEHPFYVGDLAAGESAEFNVCWQVAASDAGSLAMYVDATWDFSVEPVWFSLGNDVDAAPSHALLPPAGTPVAAGTPIAATTRDAPIPIGEAAQVGNFGITVTGVIPQADAWVAEVSPFAAPPAEGQQFTVATVTIAYIGPDIGIPYVQLGFYAVAANGTEYSFVTSGCGELPTGLDTARDVFPGGTVTHDICWQVPVTEAGDLVLRVDPFGAGDAMPVWCALHD
jgi:hypothetical protein